MRYILRLSALALIAACAMAEAQTPPPAPSHAPMGLTSSSFEDGGIVPDKYTQEKDQVGPDFYSPALSWFNVPAGTQSFVLYMHDPDSSLNKTIAHAIHWLVFNIPGTSTGLPEGVPKGAQLPDGTIQGKNNRGVPGYLGPGAGPTPVFHHYTWELFALDTKLSLGPDASLDQVFSAMNGHIIGKAALVGRFHRH